ncbi:conserved hypothetical protein [Desulforapulum autotrophicum HRM2]|uniref:DUF1178 family protein n=1 Tax=Desulforapulum autotrophicum (strain ATCC 43914 / DSM 3382 / VKM B-1955 / HRM2) TaxID=177437 RepID=C0QHS0_DESAH|nr:DUF1178 family protein [Desulforapulum autotrophicum]ACN13628.1 conserved hypothetical protein [Desulforapulum autotrophicum HRM2]
MIVFDLQCINGHTFEGWFDDGQTFEIQQEQGKILCPVCETSVVTRKLSPIAVRTSQGAAAQSRAREEAAVDLAAKVSAFIEKNFENVGQNFTREALKMHYGASEPKNIMGTTTAEDDKVLEKEGINVIKLPLPPKPEENLN